MIIVAIALVIVSLGAAAVATRNAIEARKIRRNIERSTGPNRRTGHLLP
jgi:hypothetical protein